jgi:hypothetical protein
MAHRRPIRIGNASGAIGDGIDQVYRLAKSGAVDAITADYLAEFNIAWKAIELQTQPQLGYEPNFLEQIAWENGDAARLIAQNKIKVVHDGGALNPKGLALKVDEYFKSLGLNEVKVAWVEGDDVTLRLKNGEFGNEVVHLDRAGVTLNPVKENILAANAYTGHAGIVRALQEGADIIICGRCTDASPVMGLAYWWHDWKDTDYDKLAGSLIAGHLIECGAYVTGGNYCGAPEIEKLHHVGYPIAEIAEDGTTLITKPEGSNGAVTVDTCKAQLLYEIQGPYYLNPDVIADTKDVKLEQVGSNRVKLSGVTGSMPPATTKLAICLLGGYQAEMSWYCAGLDVDYKFNLMKDQVLREINLSDFTTFSLEKYGSSRSDPQSQQECTVQFRAFAQAPTTAAMLQFRRAVFYSGMQGFCGLHLNMDWRTMEPKPYVRYFPALIAQSKIPLTVEFVGSGKQIQIACLSEDSSTTRIPAQPSYESETPLPLGSPTVRAPLGDLVFARSGDKGGNANVGFWVRDPSAYPWLKSFLTISKVIELLGNDWSDAYTVERCEFRNLWAVHFVVKGILQEGVSSSSILDGFAKSFGEFLRARHVDIPSEHLEREQKKRGQARAAFRSVL